MGQEQPFKIALIQHACAPDAQANIQTCFRMIRQAAAQGARLAVTQELFTLPYFPQTEDASAFDLAEPIPGPTSQRLCDLARELAIAICASLFEKRAAGLYHNTAIMIGPDGTLLDRYRKMHIPDDPRFYEKFYFTPGDLGFRAQTLEGISTGMLICWDQWFPEAARITALKGAQVLLYPTAIGCHSPPGPGGEPPAERSRQMEAWKTLQISHGLANGCFVAASNRIGQEGNLLFWGSSFVCDPGGTIIAQAPPDQPAVLMASLDLRHIEEARRAWPFLRDRRIDAYGEITQRHAQE